MPRKQHKYHYIYKVTCLVSGKYYIGMHSTSNLEDGYFGSGKVLRRSLNKHGKNNHTKEILEWLGDRESLKKREESLVNMSLISDPFCMNLQLGGGGGFSGEEHELKFKDAAKKTTFKEQWKNPIFSEKIKKVASITFKRLHKEGAFIESSQRGMLNKNHSNYSKNKMSETKKAKEVGKGQNNSQFGLTWITNGIENKKVKEEEIKQYIELGWKNGCIRALFPNLKTKEKITRICEGCKTEFIVKYNKRNSAKFCSKQCSAKNRSRNSGIAHLVEHTLGMGEAVGS